jgi:hypothetical protein
MPLVGGGGALSVGGVVASDVLLVVESPVSWTVGLMLVVRSSILAMSDVWGVGLATIGAVAVGGGGGVGGCVGVAIVGVRSLVASQL